MTAREFAGVLSRFHLILIGLVMLAPLSACQRERFTTDPLYRLDGTFPVCWEPSTFGSRWLPADIVTEGDFPFTDAEIEAMISDWTAGRLSARNIRQEIDSRPVLQVELLVMGSGDLFTYGLSDNYVLVFYDLIMGGARTLGYCIGQYTER